jgi:hypothetical protein
MTDSTALATTQQGAELAFLHDSSAFEHLWRVAKSFSMSRMVPQHFQNKPEDCMVALMMAQQLQVNPLLALQNLQVVNGRTGFSAAFAIGLANQRGPFQGPITWDSQGQGDDLQVTAKAVVKSTGEVVTATVSMAMAKAEGWVKNPKYRSIPEQMLKYRSATWLIRLHCPEVLLGFSTDDEAATLPPQNGAGVSTVRVVDETPKAEGNIVEKLNKQIRQKAAVLEEIVEAEVAEPEPQPDAQPDDPF